MQSIVKTCAKNNIKNTIFVVIIIVSNDPNKKNRTKPIISIQINIMLKIISIVKSKSIIFYQAFHKRQIMNNYKTEKKNQFFKN